LPYFLVKAVFHLPEVLWEDCAAELSSGAGIVDVYRPIIHQLLMFNRKYQELVVYPLYDFYYLIRLPDCRLG